MDFQSVYFTHILLLLFCPSIDKDCLMVTFGDRSRLVLAAVMTAATLISLDLDAELLNYNE